MWVVEERETRGIGRGCCESVNGERSCCYYIFRDEEKVLPLKIAVQERKDQ